MSLVKSEKEIELIRASCKIVANVLTYIKDFIKEGTTTFEIDRLIEEFILKSGGYPAFKGYGSGKNKYPASSCISVNEEVVHGIPAERKLVNGDIVSVDVGVLKDGFYGDAAYTFEVGEVSAKKKRLLNVTRESLYKGISQARDGNELNDIASAVQDYVEGSGYGVVRDLCGHGIGSHLHEEPAVLNYYNPKNRFRIVKGMTIAIEPMVNYGTYAIKTLKDGWTTVTKDKEPSAHFEHTVLVTDGEPEILTKSFY
ncbi:MAG: type I methionyl aminopeptidase [Ignavibacteriae bacterium]|nr:type I methionyl aminopeptidase [Ignavibacteriota bacterium]